jgi:hypothetical protein
VAVAAGVLLRREQAGLEHLDRRRPGERERRQGGLRRREVLHGNEAHAVARGHEGGLDA